MRRRSIFHSKRILSGSAIWSISMWWWRCYSFSYNKGTNFDERQRYNQSKRWLVFLTLYVPGNFYYHNLKSRHFETTNTILPIYRNFDRHIETRSSVSMSLDLDSISRRKSWKTYEPTNVPSPFANAFHTQWPNAGSIDGPRVGHRWRGWRIVGSIGIEQCRFLKQKFFGVFFLVRNRPMTRQQNWNSDLAPQSPERMILLWEKYDLTRLNVIQRKIRTRRCNYLLRFI